MCLSVLTPHPTVACWCVIPASSSSSSSSSGAELRGFDGSMWCSTFWSLSSPLWFLSCVWRTSSVLHWKWSQATQQSVSVHIPIRLACAPLCGWNEMPTCNCTAILCCVVGMSACTYNIITIIIIKVTAAWQVRGCSARVGLLVTNWCVFWVHGIQRSLKYW